MGNTSDRMDSCFSQDTPWEIRKQILDYHATECMSDLERAAYFGLPKGCRMRERAKIISPENLIIGENCWIGEGAILDASGHLTIGSNTSIGLGVYLWTQDSHRLNIDGTNTRDYSHNIKRAPTEIGSNCFIAGPSVVMPGVKIQDNCIISPMSVVYEDLAKGSVYKPNKHIMEIVKDYDRLKNTVAELQSNYSKLRDDVDRLLGAKK